MTIGARDRPSLARLETEAADMVSGLLHGPAGTGGLTSGGTESIFVAVSLARTVARERGIAGSEIVTAVTAHPAFATSALLCRDAETAGKRAWFDDGVWGGGMYATATPAGTRPAPPIAGAWASLRYHGEDGCLTKAAKIWDATQRLIAGIEDIDGLRLTTVPDAPVFQFTSDEVDLAAVADLLEDGAGG